MTDNSLLANASGPTVFHVTHWKAGSQWLHRILLACVPKQQIVSPQLGEVQFTDWPIQVGRVYPTVYVTKQQFDQVQLPPHSKHFVIIRDLRDTLISAYFSLKVSHAVVGDEITHFRSMLHTMTKKEGLLNLIDSWLPLCANIQMSWLDTGEQLIRYEDLLEHDLKILEPLLLDTCQLPVARDRFREIVLANRFAHVTNGRQRGEENIDAHERKGIIGDWQNHFTDRIKQAFKARYGELLIATGYEQDASW